MEYPAEHRPISAKKEINWISVKRCAVLLGKTTDWLLRFGLKEKGKAPPAYFIGGRYQFDEDEVLAWREAQKRS